MITKEIVEGNIMIAKFMGGEYREDLPYFNLKTGWFKTPANRHLHVAQDYDFKYHSSWDWIIPVVHKICDIIKEKQPENIRGSWTPQHGYVHGIFSLPLKTSLPEVWSTVVNYIDTQK